MFDTCYSAACELLISAKCSATSSSYFFASLRSDLELVKDESIMLTRYRVSLDMNVKIK